MKKFILLAFALLISTLSFSQVNGNFGKLQVKKNAYFYSDVTIGGVASFTDYIDAYAIILDGDTINSFSDLVPEPYSLPDSISVNQLNTLSLILDGDTINSISSFDPTNVPSIPSVDSDSFLVLSNDSIGYTLLQFYYSLTSGFLSTNPGIDSVYMPKLGIGLTNPSVALDVNGSIKASINVEADTAIFDYYKNLPWTENSDGLYYTDGNIGIGVDTALADLHLSGSLVISDDSINSPIFLPNSVTGRTWGVQFDHSGDYSSYFPIGSGVTIGGGEFDGERRIVTDVQYGTYTDIWTDGSCLGLDSIAYDNFTNIPSKIGIGTATPQYKLEVNWETNVNAGFFRGSTDTDITGTFMRDSDGVLWYKWIDNTGTVQTSTTKP